MRIDNRWFQLSAAAVAMVMIANLQYSWTLFVEPLRQSTGWKLSDIQWAFILFIVFPTLLQPLQGWLIDRMGPRLFFSIAMEHLLYEQFGSWSACFYVSAALALLAAVPAFGLRPAAAPQGTKALYPAGTPLTTTPPLAAGGVWPYHKAWRLP